ncbi:hypothetical protein E2C01_073184 [Portunus trituberculatus]|uniref:Uncharacterized protein n=1 Tax=Portunus trituberculatus TaxID=210409 RepID=A0A5B7I261_PORTR|nr:hypothetical protein [Portunus trituberculatus]
MSLALLTILESPLTSQELHIRESKLVEKCKNGGIEKQQKCSFLTSSSGTALRCMMPGKQ